MESTLFYHLRKLPNQLTAIRFVAVPVMWVCAVLGTRTYIGVGFIIGLVTDLLDGAAARKLNQTSDFGSKFDSLADQFLQISSIIWVLMLLPEIFTENLLVSLLALGTYLTSLTVGLIKFRRMANLHLYLSKVGGLFLYLFLIHAFMVGQYSQVLFVIAGVLFIFSSLETLILQLTSSEVYADTGSIFLRYICEDHPIRYYLSRLP
jgi:cardiolipin synthase